MKKLSGFSLMEMMIVLLIVAIVAAAAAPMINRQAITAASEKSPWVWVGSNHSIAYNLLGSNTQTASIGTTTPPDGTNARLYIDVQDNIPQLALGRSSSNVLNFLAGETTVYLSDDTTGFSPSRAQTVIGYQAGSTNETPYSVAVGYNARAIAGNSTAIGAFAHTETNSNSVAIGYHSCGLQQDAIAIGNYARTDGTRAVVIGSNLPSSGNDSVSIGSGSANGDNSIAIGGGLLSQKSTRAPSTNSIAIGVEANTNIPDQDASGNNIAIGSNVQARSANSIAIGSDCELRNQSGNTILIGTNNLSYPGNPFQIGIGSDINIGSYKSGTPYGSNTSDTIAIGHNLKPSTFSAIAIGSNIQNAMARSISIGSNITTFTTSVAIGHNTSAATNSLAIGTGASANFSNSTAIGRDAQTTASNQIVLGNANSTVFIPGNLVVQGDALIGTTYKSNVYVPVTQEQRYHKFHFKHEKAAAKTDRWYETVTIGGQTYNATSDRRLKNVGKVFAGGLAEIRKLEVFNYTFKADEAKTPRVGVMAQDLQKIFPNAVTKGDDGFLRIRMEDMFYALVNAVKDLADKFDTHDKQIADLTNQNQELQKTVTTLEKRLAELEKKVNE